MIRIAGRALGLALLLIAAAIALQLFDLPEASAQNLNNAPVIFDVRRSLPLEPDEPVYHDFYINTGPESGLKKGMFVTVVRQLPVHDPILNKQQATLSVTVGKLQVLQVERGITVARLNSELPDEERPVLEFEAVMIGDKIDLASATTVAPKAPKKKVRASASTEASPEEDAVAKADSKVEDSSATEAAAQTVTPKAEPMTTASTTSPSVPSAAVKTQAVELASAAAATGGTTQNVAVANRPVAKATAANVPSPVASSVTSSGSSENASPPSGQAGMVRIPVPGPSEIANRVGTSSTQKQPPAL